MTATRHQPAQSKPAGLVIEQKLAKQIGERAGFTGGPAWSVESQVGLHRAHTTLKKTRQRGSETPSHLASVKYLQALEAEMEQIRAALDEAWVWLDDSKSFRRCSKHMDRAQQRLHKVIKRLGKKKVK